MVETNIAIAVLLLIHLDSRICRLLFPDMWSVRKGSAGFALLPDLNYLSLLVYFQMYLSDD